MKTKLEVVEETIAFYSEDTSRRARSQNGCQYYIPDGRMCALGRCMLNPEDFQNDKNVSAGELFDEYDYDDILKPEYDIKDVLFWEDLQGFHDNNSNWADEGLTALGEVNADHLIRKYKLCSEK